MYKEKKWSVYIMCDNTKVYLRKDMTTQEALKWLDDNCDIRNTDYFMHGINTQVFCESK